MESFGEMIRQHRKNQGWTQMQLADRVGCSDSYIAQLENNNRFPSSDVRMVLAEVFELDDDEVKTFYDAAEAAELNRATSQTTKRSAAIKKAMLRKAKKTGSLSSTGLDETDIEEIIEAIQKYPYLRIAIKHLIKAVSDSRIRDSVLQALESFANIAESD